MSESHRYRFAWGQTAIHRCAHGDDQRGYCGAPAVEHVWVDSRDHTMACPAHAPWFDAHPHKDRHPITGDCGIPGSTWVYTTPAGGPGWCEVEGLDWLSARDAAEPEHLMVSARLPEGME